MASRNDGNDRRQMSNIDKSVQKSMEGVTAKTVLENLTSVLEEAYNITKGSTTSDMRQQKKLIRLSVDSIKKVIPIVEASFTSATPIPHIKYAAQCQSVARKRKERMLADITNAHKMARTTNNNRVSPSESANIVTLQNFVKPSMTAPRILLRPLKRKELSNKQASGELENKLPN